VVILLAVFTNGVQAQNGSWTSLSPSEFPLSAELLVADRDGHPLAAMYLHDFEEQRSLYRFSESIWSELRLGSYIPTTAAIDPAGELYIGTTSGIVHSTDNGATWVWIGPLLQEVTSIAFDPAGFIFAATDAGLYRTSNRGGEWLKTPFPGWHLSGVVINQAGDVFASTWAFGEGCVYRSTDKGITWRLKTDGVPSTMKDVGVLLIDKHGTLFADVDSYLYRSTDNGESWSLCLSTAWVHHVVYDLTYDILYADTPEGIVHSLSRGVSWQPLAGTAGSYGSLLLTSAGVLYASAGGLVFRYTTDHWDTLASYGLPARTVYAVTGLEGGEIVISTGRGIVRSTDKGDSWLTVSGLDGADPATQLVARRTGDLFRTKRAGSTSMTLSIDRSTDRGESWSRVFEMTGYNDGYGGPRLVMTVDPHEDLFVGGPSGIMRSTNGGIIWDSTGLKTQVYAIAAHPNGTLFAATNSDVVVSPDHGDTWVASGLDIPIGCLAVDSAGILCAGSSFAAFRSTNSGQIWQQTLLRGNTVAGLIGDADGSLRASVRNDVHYTSIAMGVFGSDDHGTSWKPMNDGLGDLDVVCFGLDRSGALYAGTRDHGLFRFMRSPNYVSPDDAGLPASFSLFPNYPNPFNPTTGIRYQVPGVSDVRLVVYDLLGRDVAVLVDERKAPGSYEVKFDAAGLASGVYFYRMTAGDPPTGSGSRAEARSYIQTRKMMLVK